MEKYGHVLMTYLTRRLAMLWIPLWLIINVCGVLRLEIRNQESLFLLFPWCIFGVAFPAFFVGVHLKQQISSPRASLMPGYRAAHLIVAACLVIALMGLMLVECLSLGIPLLPFLAMALGACLICGSLGASPNGVALAALLFCVSCLFVPHLRAFAVEFANGNDPLLVVALLSAEIAAALLITDHLLKLTEDHPDYGRVQPLDAWDFRAANLRNLQRSQMESYGWYLNVCLVPISWRLDQLTQQRAATRWDRVRLYPFGDSWPVSPIFMTAFMMLIEVVLLMVSRWKPNSEQMLRSALSVLLLFPISFTWSHAISLVHRWSRLGCESLRSVTRRDWVIENGLGIIRNITIQFGLWCLLHVVCLLIFLPEFSSLQFIAETLSWAVGTQVLVFGISSLLASFGSPQFIMIGMGTSLSGLSIAWGAATISATTPNIPLGYLSGLFGMVVGIVLSAISFRRWCTIDLA